jgi:O-antigen/teichoic acid export membrane protein
MYCLITSIICSVFLLLGKQIGGLIYNDPAVFTLIEFLSIPFATTSFYSVQKMILFARAHYKIVLIMDILYAASNIAILIVLHECAMLHSAIWFYVARSGAALVALLPVVCLFKWSKQRAHPRIQETFAYKDYFEHSKYSSITMVSSYAQAQVDTLAVAHYLTPLSAATYGAAKIFFTGITMVTTGFTMVVLPTSSRITVSGEEGLGRFYRRALLLAYALLLPSVAVLAVFVHPVLHLVFGSRYADAAPIVRIFCLTALVIPVSSITDSVANGAGWWRQACAAAVTGGVIGMAASLCLTRVAGLCGAALSPILALSGSAGVITLLTWRRLSTRGRTLNIKARCDAPCQEETSDHSNSAVATEGA